MSESFYIVEKSTFSTIAPLMIDLQFKDKDGNPLLSAKGEAFKLGVYDLKDNDGTMISRIKRKGLLAGNLRPVIELYDGSNTLIGKVEYQPGVFSQVSGQKLKFVDANGSTIANVSGDILGLNYDIVSENGDKVIAKINRQLISQNGVKDSVVKLLKKAYGIQILDKSVPTLLLLEFAVVVEHIQASENNSGLKPAIGPISFG